MIAWHQHSISTWVQSGEDRVEPVSQQSTRQILIRKPRRPEHRAQSCRACSVSTKGLGMLHWNLTDCTPHACSPLPEFSELLPCREIPVVFHCRFAFSFTASYTALSVDAYGNLVPRLPLKSQPLCYHDVCVSAQLTSHMQCWIQWPLGCTKVLFTTLVPLSFSTML